MSSVILQPSDEEDKGLEQIVTEGAEKSLLVSSQESSEKVAFGSSKGRCGDFVVKISDMFPDPSGGPYKEFLRPRNGH